MLNVMLVDDEKTVLKGLSHILAKHCPEYEVVKMAQSAAEALHFLQDHRVDVVISDVKMPEMDGIELTQNVRTLYPQTSVVILSGHADFEYVRQTMKNGACDYLLKPCHYQNVLDILRKIEDRNRQSGADSERKSHLEHLKAAVAGKQPLSGEWASYADMAMAVISVPGSRDPLFEEHLKQEIKKWKVRTEPELIGFGDNTVVITRDAADLPSIKQKLYAYRQGLYAKGFAASIAIERFGYNPNCLERAYAACLSMIEFAAFHEICAVMDAELYRKYMDKQKDISFRSRYSSETLGRYILSGDVANMQRYLESNLHELYHSGLYLDPARVRNEAVKELIYLEHHMKEHGFEHCLDKTVDYIRETNSAPTFRQLLGWLKKFTMGMILSSVSEDQVPQYIHKAIKFIEQHYMEELSLKTVSDVVYLNPWYFSTQFKKHLNLSFSEYLNQVRVRMAKQFLKQSDLKVYQVAEMVGFQDAAYFSTVFKNIEYMSPKEFQQSV